MAANPWDFSQILLQGGNAGQLIGRGIENAASGISQGIQQYAQNKQMASRDIAEFEAVAQSNPQLLQTLQGEGVSKEVSSAFKKLQSGGVGSKDAAILSSFARTYTAGQQAQRAAQLQQMQLAEAQRTQAAGQRLGMLNQYMGGVGQGILRPEVQQQMKGMAADPTMSAAAKIYQATGQIPSAKDLMDYAEVQAKMSGKGANQLQEVVLPSGAKAAFNPNTGVFSVLPRSSSEAAAVAGAEAEAQLSAKDAQTLLTDISERGEAASARLSAINRIRDLYKEGATSGFGQPILTKARAAFARLGLGNEGLATQQQFEKEINSVNLLLSKEALKGGGSVSNFERELVQNAQANASLDPAANIAIFDALAHIDERNQRLAKMRNDLEDQGLTTVEIAKRIRRERDKSPIPNIEALQQIGGGKATVAAPASQITTPSGIKIISIKKVE